jgi:hypothetical protein
MNAIPRLANSREKVQNMDALRADILVQINNRDDLTCPDWIDMHDWLQEVKVVRRTLQSRLPRDRKRLEKWIKLGRAQLLSKESRVGYEDVSNGVVSQSLADFKNSVEACLSDITSISAQLIANVADYIRLSLTNATELGNSILEANTVDDDEAQIIRLGLERLDLMDSVLSFSTKVNTFSSIGHQVSDGLIEELSRASINLLDRIAEVGSTRLNTAMDHICTWFDTLESAREEHVKAKLFKEGRWHFQEA